MRRLKINAWCPPPVSKVFALRWSLLKKNEIPPFVGTDPFLCTCITPLPVRGLWEFLHSLMTILIQLKKFFFFIYSRKIFLPHLNLQGGFFSVNSAKEEIEKKSERERYFFNFNFISFGIFARLFWSEEMSSWTIWESSFFLNQAIKCVSRLRLFISPNSVWSCRVVSSFCFLRRVGSLAADTTHMRVKKTRKKKKKACYLLVSWWKKVLSVWSNLLSFLLKCG